MLIKSDDKQFLMAHGRFNATIKISTSTVYINEQLNKHFIKRINCTNNNKFNKDIKYMCNKLSNYAVHKFLQDIFIKDIEKNNTETNKKYRVEKKINRLGLHRLIKIGLNILIMYQFTLFLNQHNTIKRH